MIELVLNEYKINTKVTHMVTDNASNFAKAFRYDKYLLLREDNVS